MKRLSVVLAAIASILLIIIITFSMLQLVVNDETFINNEITKIGMAPSMGMNNLDLVHSTMQLVHYIEGTAPSIDITVTVNGEETEMFSLEQEKTHMADVKTIWQTCRQGRDIGLLVVLILYLLAVVMGFRTALSTLSKGYLYGAFVCILIFGFIGTWAAMDFSSFWTMFHQSLFWNDLWLFDAAESRMINMLPEQMFSDIIARMALYTGIAAGALLAAAIVCLVMRKRKRENEKQEKLRRKAIRERMAAGLPIEDDLLTKKQLAERRRKEKEAAQKAAAEAREKAAREKKKAQLQKKREEEKKKAALLAEREAKQQALLAEKAAKKAAKAKSAPESDADDWLSSDADEPQPQAVPAAERPVKKRKTQAGTRTGNAKKRKRNDPFELILPDENDESL